MRKLKHMWWSFRCGLFIFHRMYLPPEYVAWLLIDWERRHPEP